MCRLAALRHAAIFAVVASLSAANNAPGPARVLAVDANAVIHPVIVDVLRSAIQQANSQKYDLILVRLNTPGGFADATRDAITAIVTSPVPVATYVYPSGSRAASAGFFLLEAGDVAAMAPGTNTGAAHPVALLGQPDETMMKKIENDAAASMRSLVERRGRNVAIAEKTVVESKSFTSTEALDQHLIEIVASNESDLFKQLDGRSVKRFDGTAATLYTRDARVDTFEPTWTQRFRIVTSDPNVALGLVLLGALGIYVEFTTPGVILPGVCGAIALLWGLASLAVLPLTWTGAALLLLGMALLVLEAKVTSHGILAAAGCFAMVLGAIFLIDTPVPELRIHLGTALSFCLPFAVITFFLVTLVVQARHHRVETGSESMIGSTGVAFTDISPVGRVMVHGELWEAKAPDTIAANTRVQVVEIHGLELTVKPAP